MAEQVTLYGIKSCDTMRKARVWLEEHGVSYVFHDYKTQGLDTVRLQKWVGQVGWEKLLNKAGTTFRKLPDAEKASLTVERAVALMLAQPSMVKRPVLEGAGRVETGFKPELYAAFFNTIGK